MHPPIEGGDLAGGGAKADGSGVMTRLCESEGI